MVLVGRHDHAAPPRARGGVNPSDVMLVMGFTVLGQLSTDPGAWPVRCVVSTLHAVLRMYRDSEMVIWFASGRGLAMNFALAAIHTTRSCWWWLQCCRLAAAQTRSPAAPKCGAQYEQREHRPCYWVNSEESANGAGFFIVRTASEPEAGNNVFIATSTGNLRQ